MTRLELLQLLIGQARSNGFQFRRWYTRWMGLPWNGSQSAVELLTSHRQYYALLFSAEFAESFWKARERMTIQVPVQTFQRVKPDGTVGTVTRKGFTRRVARPDAWRYHLGRMAVAEDPLRYIRRFLRVEGDLEPPLPDDSAGPSGGNEGDPRFIVDQEDLLEDDD